MATKRVNSQRAGSIKNQLERIEFVLFLLLRYSSVAVSLTCIHRTDPAHHLTGPFRAQTYSKIPLLSAYTRLNVSLDPLAPRMAPSRCHQPCRNLRRTASGLTSRLFDGLCDHVRVPLYFPHAYTHFSRSVLVQDNRHRSCSIRQLGGNHPLCGAGITQPIRPSHFHLSPHRVIVP